MGTLTEQVSEDGTVAAFGGGLSQQAKCLGQMVIVVDVAQAMHALSQSVPILLCEGTFSARAFKVQALGSHVVHSHLWVGDASVEGLDGEARSSDPSPDSQKAMNANIVIKAIYPQLNLGS